MRASVKGFVSGRVQGVGFRYFVRSSAQMHGLSGYAINLADGRVEFLLQGELTAIERVIGQIRSGPRHARVDDVTLEPPREREALQGFVTR
jgi:acylphosphatase